MRGFTVALLFAGCAVAGCNKPGEATTAGPKSPGRFAGIGTFEAGRLWQQMVGAPASQDPGAAKLADDEHVIVVLDSHTGEVRQCGDHSGFCVAMNPWSAPGSAATVPVKLSKHATDLDAENEASANASEPAEATKDAAAPR